MTTPTQVHCTLLHYITQLKKIYHYYSSLGQPGGGGAHQAEAEGRRAHYGSSMTRMQVCISVC